MDIIPSQCATADVDAKTPTAGKAHEAAWSEFTRMPPETMARKLAKMPEKGYFKVRLNASTIRALEAEVAKVDGWEYVTDRGREKYFPLPESFRRRERPAAMRDLSTSAEPEMALGRERLTDLAGRIISFIENKPHVATIRHYELRINNKANIYHTDSTIQKLVATYTIGNSETTRFFSKDTAENFYATSYRPEDDSLSLSEYEKSFKKDNIYFFLARGIKNTSSYVLVHASPPDDPERIMLNARWK